MSARGAALGSETREPEPYRRQWLHALEGEPTAPSGAMQLARVYADYAPASGGRATQVSYPQMRKHTHMSNDKIEAGNGWLVEHGWLVPREGKNGQRKVYDLTFGHAGKKREPVKPSQEEPLRQPERSTGQNRSGSRNGRDAGDLSGGRNTTSPVAGTPPLRLSEHEQNEQNEQENLSPRLKKLYELLATEVPDVTEREFLLVIEELDSRRNVESGAAVLPVEIANGKGPALVAKVRHGQDGAARWLSWSGTAGEPGNEKPTPTPPPLRDLCGWCKKPGHTADACRDRQPDPAPKPQARPVAAPAEVSETPCAAGGKCHQRHTDVPAGGWHTACELLVAQRVPKPRAGTRGASLT